MYLFLLPAASVPIANIHTEPLRTIAEANGGTVDCLPAIRMFCADGKVLTGWLSSQSDLLAEDWRVLDAQPGICGYCNEIEKELPELGGGASGIVATVCNDLQTLAIHHCDGHEDVTYSIKFCPMCGKELKEEL